ncbi:asparagine synthase (glutamine-hydrolyzing) [Phormidium sp. FACHB-1136]|uniref:asparagine synthase (glutamine-hydrolyzing) n=1 Tax=Phormidium sp. FACHB-1136 TaxID=2692848 RepID=UPI001682DF05|nr:asparagine synthase (glutamine-hydrolyzing) [Phormidium sp. FACHB-1136]MBD2428617.1 asparagine synthase (glutamine-hydrolyzing) [Phormidium sp. FACHB-1136]
MCGIAGMVLRGAAVDESMMQPMVEQLQHRGPDGMGMFLEGAFGLCHTRLSIIDLDGGRQPLLHAKDRLAVVANGEIYNFVELREQLQAEGRGFATHSDCECILHTYAQDAHGFVDRLHGMFAFALYDSVRKKLILARDRLGIKPLFYAVLPDRLVFASEIKALLPMLPRQPAINPSALSQFLHNHCSSGEETIFQGVRHVAPGEIIEIDGQLNVSRRWYWNPFHVKTRPPETLHLEDEFDHLFGQVIKEHARSDVPYGLFLSGGNDSAILLAMLARFQDKPVRTFSIGFEGARLVDELDAAERIAGVFGSQHTSIRMSQAAFFKRIPYTIWAADDLMRDNASLPTSLLSEVASRELKVVFCGEGGDEVFGGYPRYYTGRWRWLLENLRAPGSGGFRTRSDWSDKLSQCLLGGELSRQWGSFRQHYIEAWQSTPPSWSHLQRCQYTDIATDLTDSLLVKSDRMMMGFGLEGRVPFLDHRVVEFGLSLPDHLKVSRGRPKVFLRRWAERYLPKNHLYMPKKGFAVPVREWLSGDFLDRLESRLWANPAINTWFNTAGFPTLFQMQRKNGGASREIFGLMQFAIWHRLFVEQPGARPSPDEDPLDWIS